jgi:hypothetical protein
MSAKNSNAGGFLGSASQTARQRRIVQTVPAIGIAQVRVSAATTGGPSLYQAGVWFLLP